MNEAIVERWNSVVPADGKNIIYHLGDMALSDTTGSLSYIRRLHGTIRWIRGNHCTDNRVLEILAKCPEKVELISPDMDNAWAYVLKEGKWRFYLSHYPTKVANFDDIGTRKTWCLCGHSHTKDKWQDLADSCYHVEMDAHDCYPVSLERIKADIIALKQKSNSIEKPVQNFKIK